MTGFLGTWGLTVRLESQPNVQSDMYILNPFSMFLYMTFNADCHVIRLAVVCLLLVLPVTIQCKDVV